MNKKKDCNGHEGLCLACLYIYHGMEANDYSIFTLHAIINETKSSLGHHYEPGRIKFAIENITQYLNNNPDRCINCSHN